MKMKAGGEERREEGCRNRKLVLKKMPKIANFFFITGSPTVWYPDWYPYEIFCGQAYGLVPGYLPV